MIKRSMLVTLLAILAVVASSSTAQAHFQGYSAVDGYEIRYEDYTQWNDALGIAIAGWENLSGGVNIAPDISSTTTDLQVVDYAQNDGRCGFYDSSGFIDVIALNYNFFNPSSTNNRRACMLHEWGHAHGLAHSYSTQAMDACPTTSCPGGSAFITPQNHDRSDYYYLW